MARTLIDKSTFNGLEMAKKATPTTLDSTNNMYCVFSHDNISVVIANSSDIASITVAFEAVDKFDDFVVTIPANETYVVSNLESAYYKQADGNLNITVSANTGTIFAIEDVV